MEDPESLTFKLVSNDELAQIMGKYEEDIDRIVTTMVYHVAKNFNNTEVIEQIVQGRFAEIWGSGDWINDEVDGREAAETEGPAQEEESLAPAATVREERRISSNASLQGRGGTKTGSCSSSRGNGYLPGRRGESRTGSLSSSRGNRAPHGRSGPSRGRQEAGRMIDNEWAANQEGPEDKQEQVEKFDKVNMKPITASDFFKENNVEGEDKVK